jgi:hypothetical protein
MTTATYSPVTSAFGQALGGQIGSTVGSVPFGMQQPFASYPSHNGQYGLADPSSAAHIAALVSQLSGQWNPNQSIMGMQSPQMQSPQMQSPQMQSPQMQSPQIHSQQIQAQQIQVAAYVQALQQTLQSLQAQLQQALIQQSHLQHAARQSQHPYPSVVGSY